MNRREGMKRPYEQTAQAADSIQTFEEIRQEGYLYVDKTKYLIDFIDALIALIEPENLPWQFFFGTQRAADLLHFNRRRVIR
jgi:hypothetical protein